MAGKAFAPVDEIVSNEKETAALRGIAPLRWPERLGKIQWFGDSPGSCPTK
jgi:hypothetical protein